MRRLGRLFGCASASGGLGCARIDGGGIAPVFPALLLVLVAHSLPHTVVRVGGHAAPSWPPHEGFMADAGPSNSNSASSSHHAVTPPSSVSRASHIRFPQDHDPGSADSSRKSTMSQQVASLGLGRPPVSRRTTSRSSTHGDKNNTKHTTTDEARPRVKSVDAPMSSPGPSRARLGADLNINSARKPTPPSHRLSAARRTRTRGGMAEAEVEGDTSYISKIFSDEYDLGECLAMPTAQYLLMSCYS